MRTRLTDRLVLGEGLEVSPVCLGMVDDPKTVAAAYEAGINFFFVTADMHWPLYSPLREGLKRLLKQKRVRERIVVCGPIASLKSEEILKTLPVTACIKGAFQNIFLRHISLMANFG